MKKLIGEKEPIGLIEGIRQHEANKPPVRIEEELQRMNEVNRKPKVMTIYGGIEFIEKLRKALSKKQYLYQNINKRSLKINNIVDHSIEKSGLRTLSD